jgi:hypothetical protein
MTQRISFLVVAVVLLATGPSSFAAPVTRPVSDGTSLEELRVTAQLEEARQARDAYEADKLVAQAVREEMRGRDVEAAALYSRAFDLDRNNARAAAGLRDVRERLGLLVEPSPMIDRTGKELRTKRQETLYRFETAMAAASDAMTPRRPEGFSTSRLYLDRARLILSDDVGVFSREESARLASRIREQELALKLSIQQREGAVRAAQERDWAERIKSARVHDKRL